MGRPKAMFGLAKQLQPYTHFPESGPHFLGGDEPVLLLTGHRRYVSQVGGGPSLGGGGVLWQPLGLAAARRAHHERWSAAGMCHVAGATLIAEIQRAGVGQRHKLALAAGLHVDEDMGRTT